MYYVDRDIPLKSENASEIYIQTMHKPRLYIYYVYYMHVALRVFISKTYMIKNSFMFGQTNDQTYICTKFPQTEAYRRYRFSARSTMSRF